MAIFSNKPGSHNTEEAASVNIEALPLAVDYQRAPKQFQPLLEAAIERTEEFSDPKSSSHIPSLVSTGGNIAWSQLSAVANWFEEKSGNRFSHSKLTFCEWGSGLGINTCIASMFGWKAIGIELESNLVAAANRLSQDFGLTASFFEASYKPEGFDETSLTDSALRTKHGFGLFDFDIIYGYYWPAEYKNVKTFFSRYGKQDSLFLMYSGGSNFEMLRKLHRSL